MAYGIKEYKFNTVGLDKMKLKRFPIKVVDVEKLYSRGNVTVSDTSLYKREFITPTGAIALGEVIISDEIFNLKIGLRRVNVNKFVPYESIEVNPAAIINGANIDNISNSSDLHKAISIIEKRVLDYGLEVELMEAAIEEMEINTNIRLEEDFNSYRNVFELMKKCLPKPYKCAASYEDRELERYTGFKVGNKEISLKFYDKFIEQGMLNDYSVLRIEYRLLKENKVKDKFEFATIKELLNEFYKVGSVFRSLVNKDITTKVTTYIKKLVKFTYDLLIEAKNKDYQYIKYFLATTQDDQIFDFDIVSAAIGRLSTDRSNKWRNKKDVKKYLQIREENGKNLFFNNIVKINEILTSLGEDPIVI